MLLSSQDTLLCACKVWLCAVLLVAVVQGQLDDDSPSLTAPESFTSTNTEVTTNGIEDKTVEGEPAAPTEHDPQPLQPYLQSDSKLTRSLFENNEGHIQEIKESGDVVLLKTNTENSASEFGGEDRNYNENELAKEGFIPANTSYVVPPVNNTDTFGETTDVPVTYGTTMEITPTESVLGVKKQDNPQLETEHSTSTTTEDLNLTVTTETNIEENNKPVEKDPDASTEQVTNTPPTNTSALGYDSQESVTADSDQTKTEVPDITVKPDSQNNTLKNGTEEEPNGTIEENDKPVEKDPDAHTEQGTDTPPTNNTSVLGNDSQESVTANSNQTKSEVPDITVKPDSQNNTLKNGTEAEPNGTMQPLVKDVAGAKIVLFCIAVFVIFLVLFNIYKCWTQSKEENTRTVVDLESRIGTEMQDLLPKPQEKENKNNLKCQGTVTMCENVKLLTEEIENKLPKLTPVDIANNKVDDENSLHINKANGINGKKPEIKT